MSEWLQLDPQELDELNPGEAETADGVEVHVFISPYDMPEAIRGRFDDERDRFAIEFKYLSDETMEDHIVDDHVTWQVGKHSGRLYGIFIDVQALRAQSIQLNMHILELAEEEIDRAFTRPPESSALRRVDNYRVAKDLIARKRQRLFEPLQPC